jgi:hypothetical protein
VAKTNGSNFLNYYRYFSVYYWSSGSTILAKVNFLIYPESNFGME